MNTIGIISNNEKQKAIEVAFNVYKHLKNRKIKVLLPEEDLFPEKYSLPSVPMNIFSFRSEMILSVGGDGTFLRAAKYSFKNKVPILGINAGNLGFLTEIDIENINKTLDELLKGSYHLEKRMLLEGTVLKEDNVVQDTGLPELALNEFAIARSMSEKVIKMEILVNNVFIKKFLI